MRKAIRLLINRIQLRKTCAVVEWYQEGNQISVKIQKIGVFKRFVGIPFVCKIDIDPTKVTQSP